MPTFRIILRREIEQFHELEIEADDKDEASDLANDEAENIADEDWSNGQFTSDVEVRKVTELSESGDEVKEEDDDEEEA
jgi:hypothetical protein